MGHTRGVGCQVHAWHRPRVSEPDVHHVWPLGDGGPDTAENRVVVCPTGHRNIHVLLAHYRAWADRGQPPWSIRRRYTRGEQRLAARGWTAITTGTLPAA